MNNDITFQNDKSNVLKNVCPFKLGVTVNRNSIMNLGDLIKREFNSVTCENAMKLNYRFNLDGSYNFAEADYIYNFAKLNGVNIRGHVFVWDIDFPYNQFENFTRDELLAEIRRYIKAVAERYPLVYAWDVVNEAINGEPGDLLRDTMFKAIIGSDYIEQVFKIAREELGENVALFLNEDDEWRLQKPQNILKYVGELLQKNVPIDGIGLQCHISPYEDLSQYRTLLEGIRKLNLRCHITEMEVSVYNFVFGKYEKCPDEIYALQSDTYRDMFRLFLEYSDIIDLVNFWSLTDKATWRDNWPVVGRKD